MTNAKSPQKSLTFVKHSHLFPNSCILHSVLFPLIFRPNIWKRLEIEPSWMNLCIIPPPVNNRKAKKSPHTLWRFHKLLVYEKRQTSWWRAQSIRYMLRWPTPYLCHIINQVRHATMGKEVANRIVAAELGQQRAKKLLGKGGDDWIRVAGEREMMNIEGEPFMPRPIVSLHVRQGDKAKEMQLFSFAAHMWMAERLRFHVPNLQTIWLSTEMQVRLLNYWRGRTWMVEMEIKIDDSPYIDNLFLQHLYAQKSFFFFFFNKIKIKIKNK